MIIRRTARHIGMEGIAEIGRCIVPAHRLAGILGGGDFRQHLLVTGDHAGEIHHLAQTDDVGPLHRLANVLGAERGAGILEAGRAGHTGRHLHEDVDRHGHRLVMHQPDAGQAQHIGDFVRVDEHRCGAMRDHRAGELGDRHHAAFDMHVRVAQARHKVAALRIDHLRCLADAMRRAGPYIGEAARGDGNVGAGDDLARMDVHPSAIADHRVSRVATHGDGDEAGGGIGPGFQHGSLHWRAQAIMRMRRSSAQWPEMAIFPAPTCDRPFSRR